MDVRGALADLFRAQLHALLQQEFFIDTSSDFSDGFDFQNCQKYFHFALGHQKFRTDCGEQPTFLEGVSFLDTAVLQRTFEEVKMEVT